jgi:hypothetical protein
MSRMRVYCIEEPPNRETRETLEPIIEAFAKPDDPGAALSRIPAAA